jgi:hypothetical protein
MPSTRSLSLATQALVSLVATTLAVSACGGASGGMRSDDHPFPERAAVEALRAQPATPPTDEAEPAPELPEWSLSEAPPARFGGVSQAPEDTLTRVLRETQGTRDDRYYTEGMHCAAREVANAWAVTGMAPNSRVSDWIARECGTLSRSVQTTGWYADSGGHIVNGVPSESWQGAVRGMSLPAAFADQAVELGVAAVERDGRTAMVVAMGAPSLVLDPVARTPDERGHIVLSGTLLVPSVNVESSITVGETGRRECVSRLQGARFTIDCRMEPGEEQATLELSSWEPGRILGSALWWGSARRAHEVLPAYRSRSAGSERDVASAESIAEAVNRIRQDAGLGEPRLLPEQSRANQDLAARYYFPRPEDDEGEVRDLIALSLMAGWSVGEPVMGAHFRGLSVDNSSAVSAWLEEMLASPKGRAVILQPEYDAIAIGLAWGADRRRLRTLVTTYTLVDDTPREELARIARARVQEQRRARERPDARVLVGVPELQRAMDSVLDELEAGTLYPDDATEELFDRIRRETRRPLHAWPAWASAVNEVSFHETILDEDDLNLLIGVARVNNRSATHPWGGYFVIVLHIGGAVQQAEGETPEGPEVPSVGARLAALLAEGLVVVGEGGLDDAVGVLAGVDGVDARGGLLAGGELVCREVVP